MYFRVIEMMWNLYEDEDFDSYYVLKYDTGNGEKYFFTARIAVSSAGLAHQFNTLRSVKQCIKRCKITDYRIEKIKRKN